MLAFFPITLLFFLFIYEFRNYTMLKNAKFLYEKDGIKFYKIEAEEDNAITIKSLIFGRNIIVIGKERNEILAHEEGHIKQPNFLLYFLVVSALAISYSVLSIPFLLIIYKVMFLHFERDADLYAYYKYNIMYIAHERRPVKRLERLRAWILDTHPPDWVRASKEYYDKKTNIFRLFVCDLML